MTKTDVFLLLATVVFNASASLLVKKGAGALVGGQKVSGGVVSMIISGINAYTVAGIILLGLSFVMYVMVLSRIQLSIAQPMLALSYVLVGVSAHFLFGEPFTASKVAGIGIIMVGVVLVSGAIG